MYNVAYNSCNPQNFCFKVHSYDTITLNCILTVSLSHNLVDLLHD